MCTRLFESLNPHGVVPVVNYKLSSLQSKVAGEGKNSLRLFWNYVRHGIMTG